MDPSPTEISKNKTLDPSKSQNYGARLLPQVVDELAISDPQRIYGTFPQSSDLSNGFRDVTMLEMSQAIDRAAHWLESVIGRSTQFETIAYMGLFDLRYAIIFLATVKCGYKLLVPSIRNSTWMNVSLFEQTGCKNFFYAVELSPKIQTLKDALEGLKSFSVAPLDDLLRGEAKPYPFDTTYSKACWDPILVAHSSGSTGPPKPIVTNHASWAVVDNDRNLPTVKGRKNQSFNTFNWNGGGRFFAAFPPFHLGGIVAYIALPIYSSQATVVLGPADRPPTGQVAFQIMQRFQIRALFCPPSIYEQLVQEDTGLELTKGLDFILYAGGPLSTDTGSKLSQVTDVCQFYGSTEAGPAQTLIPRKEDWEYLEWHPNYGADMQPSEDDAFELVLHKDRKYEGIRCLDCNFRNIDDWHTKDLFRPHPSKPGLWKFHSRLDDIIVLSNGLKFNPVYSETAIGTHPLLSGALIVGQGRFLAALLIEPKEGTSKTAFDLIEAIWPAVEKANDRAPDYGRVIRSMILVASEEKRFERAGKGTVIRGMTTTVFATEIAALYSSENTNAHGPKLTAPHDLDSVREYVRACIQMSFSLADFHNDQDLYVSGLDSLKTIEIATLLKAGVENNDVTWLLPQFIYANPTVNRVANILFKNLGDSTGAAEGRANGIVSNRKEKMAFTVDDFTRNLQKRSFGNAPLPRKTQRKVLLTGSTGSLGSHILRALLRDPDVLHVTCVNRSANGRERQLDIFKKFGSKQVSLISSKVEFLQVNYGEPLFGLPSTQYEQLLSSVDVIIHNAWKVDFNHSLESFRQVHIQGVRNLVDFCLQSQYNPHLVFLSSISSVGRWSTLQPNGNPPPEEIVSDYNAAQEMGYAESKLVAENILHRASQTTGIPVSILRVGQIAGPVDSPGVWNEQEWVPALIKTSKALGILPDYIPDPDWIPVDLLARIVLDISNRNVTQGKAAFYNVVNPNTAAWKTLIPLILSHLGPQVRTVGLSEWSRMLEQVDTSNPKELIDKPAAKILPFFWEIESKRKDGRAGHNTAKAVAASQTMADLKAVNADWMQLWLKQWGY